MSVENADIFPEPMTIIGAANASGVDLCNILLAVGFRAVNRGVPLLVAEHENPNPDARAPLREYAHYVDARTLAAVTKAVELREKLAANLPTTDTEEVRRDIARILGTMSDEAMQEYVTHLRQHEHGSPFEE